MSPKHVLAEDKALRNKELCASYRKGASISTLAQTSGLQHQTVYAILKKSACPLRRKKQQTTSTATRNRTIATAFKAGTPMPDLAKAYGLTRQGVQLILKQMNLGAKDGGAGLRAKQRKQTTATLKILNKEQQCATRWGCSLEQWQLLRSMHPSFHHTPIARFIQHRNNVLRKKLRWSLTLWQWWSEWNDSGRYHERGRQKQSYCMARRQNTGDYAVGNVVIMSIQDNLCLNRRPKAVG